MPLLNRLIKRMSEGLALIGGLGIILMLLHISADVLSRHIFNHALPATTDIVARYYMVAAAFLPLAWVEGGRSMIAVEIMGGMMSPRMLRVSDVLVLLVSAAIYAGLTYTTLLAALPHFHRGAFILSLSTPIPVWPTYFVLPAAFAIAGTTTFARAISLAFTDDRAEPAGTAQS